MATSEDVARLAGVSRATVSRVLNGSARVSAAAHERVYAAIAALGYEPDVVAQSLVRQRSRIIAVSLFPQGGEPPLARLGQTAQFFYLGMLENIEREAISLGYDVLLSPRQHDKSPQSYVRSLQARRVAGVHYHSLRARCLYFSLAPLRYSYRLHR